MLDEQFFSNASYYNFLTDNFVLFKAVQGEHDDIYRKYSSDSEITVIADKNGTEVDRVVGYSEADIYKERVIEAWKGEYNLVNLLNKYRTDPENFDTQARLLEKYTSHYNWDKAVGFADIVLKREPLAKKTEISHLLYGNRARVSLYEFALGISIAKNPDAAVRFFNEFPDSEISDRVYGLLRMNLSNEATREQTVEVFKQLLTGIEGREELVIAFLQFASRRNSEQEYALKLAERGSKVRFIKNDNRFVRAFATLLVNAGRISEAEKMCTEYMNYEPSNVHFKQSAYNIFHGAGEYDAALKLVRRGLTENPENIYFKYAFARTAISAEKHLDEAESMLDEFLAASGNAGGDNAVFAQPRWQAATYWRFGQIALLQGDRERAKKMYETGLRINPDYGPLRNALAELK